MLFEVPYSVLYYWKDNRLLRVAAYAADGEKERSLGKVSLAPGEGLVGQSAVEKRVLRMNDIATELSSNLFGSRIYICHITYRSTGPLRRQNDCGH